MGKDDDDEVIFILHRSYILTMSVSDGWSVTCLFNVARKPQATGTPGQRRPVTVSSPHRQTDLCTSALCFGVSYTKLLSSHMTHPPDSNPGALARAPIHEQALNRVRGTTLQHLYI
jgi:hypothetical protein